jgi:hypothetical protein
VLEKVMENMRAVDEKIRAAGAWVFTGGLHEPSTADREPNRASNTTLLRTPD